MGKSARRAHSLRCPDCHKAHRTATKLRKEDRAAYCLRLGQAMRKVRKERGLSLRSVAERAELTDHKHLLRLEQGKQSPTMRILERILKALRVKYEELMA